MKRLLSPALFSALALLTACSSTPEPAERQQRTIEPEPVQENLLARGDEAAAASIDELLDSGDADAPELRQSDEPRPATGRSTSLTLVIAGDTDPRLAERFTAVSRDYPVAITETWNALPELPGNCEALELEERCLRALRRETASHGVLVIAADAGDQRRLTLRHYELRIPEAYARERVALPTGRNGIPAASLEQLAEQTLLKVTDRARVLPWSASVIGREDTLWRLSGRQDDGLEEGEELIIVRGARVLRSVTGRPASWLPGEPVGRMRIEGFAEDGHALAILVDGSAPRDGDLLLPAP